MDFDTIEFPYEYRLDGELSRILGLEDFLGEYNYQWPRFGACFEPAEPPAAYKSEPYATDRQPFARESSSGRLRALIIRDSFATAIEPYMNQHFARAAYIWERPSLEMFQRLIEQEQPDIVIEQRVSRMLRFPPVWRNGDQEEQ
jgi:hypothetical protein